MIPETNALFICDALTLLERLPSESVTLVYLDPPWYTKGGFTSGSEKQSFEKYVSYLSKIVQQVRRILTQKGSLFVHWAPPSPVDVRLVMNQSFAASQPNYEITLPIKRPGYSSPHQLRIEGEFLLVYTKSDRPTYNPVYRPLYPEEVSRYRLKDNNGRYVTDSLISPFDRPTMQFTWRGYTPPPGKSWRHELVELDAFAEKGRIHFLKTGEPPRLKRYLHEHPGIKVGTIWDDIFPTVRDDESESLGYSLQRPLVLLERILRIATNERDRILDPFCGSGTSLVMAQQLGRQWWGVDISSQAYEITTQRLSASCDLESVKDYAVLSEAEVVAHPVVDASYRPVLISVNEIAAMQQQVHDLNVSLLMLKKRMNLGEDAGDDKIEQALALIQQQISESVTTWSKPVDAYINLVRSWLTEDGWGRLDEASKTFLPQAEMLHEILSQDERSDYSPFIIQYCRALENELLTKLFAQYTVNFHARIQTAAEFLEEDLIEGSKTHRFANNLSKQNKKYMLGEMSFIMNLMKTGGRTLEKSALLQDFRAFTIHYFSEKIVDKAYLEQIEKINEDFRVKAAHPYVLDAIVAEECRKQVRACLKKFILNYRGDSPGNIHS